MYVYLPSVSTHVSYASYRLMSLAAMRPARPSPLPSSRSDRLRTRGRGVSECVSAVEGHSVPTATPSLVPAISSVLLSNKNFELSLSKSHILREPNLSASDDNQVSAYVTHTLTHSHTYKLQYYPLRLESPTCIYIHAYIHITHYPLTHYTAHSLHHSLTTPLTHSLHHSLTHYTTHSLTTPLTHSLTSWCCP
jgi:hypothetical protein